MVICFSCSPETKKLLDDLIASGQYRDHSEVLGAAVANLSVIHSELGRATSIVIGREEGTEIFSDEGGGTEEGSSASSPRTAATPSATSDQRASLAKPPLTKSGIPPIFQQREGAAKPPQLAQVKADRLPLTTAVSLDQWLFGQFNRLLPAKITCRALVNMATDGLDGQSLEKIAIEIANQAAQFGQYLTSIDEKRNLGRDDAMAVAFPAIGQFKSIQRFANQFVGSTNKEGHILGLPASLKLIGPHPEYPDRVVLTEAGWHFGSMSNPLLDSNSAGKTEKFSDSEVSFLLDHIASAVRVEAFAYTSVLHEIMRGVVTPDSLDEALAKLPGQAKRLKPPFVSTQRSGVICRMADLDLIARSRTATRVSYLILQRGKDFLRLAESASAKSVKSTNHN